MPIKVRLELEEGTNILLLEDGDGLLLFERSGARIIKGGITSEPGPAGGTIPPPLIADKLTAPENFDGTAPEFAVFQALNRLGFRDRFEFQSSKFGGRALRGGLVLDFFIPSLGVALLISGEYWHYERAGQVARDLLQRQQLESSGITAVFIDEDDAIQNAAFFVSEALRGIDHSKLTRGF